MLKISEIVRSGTIAGLRAGDSYEDVIRILGHSDLYNEDDVHPGCQYGDLEFYFAKTNSGLIVSLIYFNRGCRQIQLDAAIPFDSQGLNWGMPVEQVCAWLVTHRVPFSYDPQKTYLGSPSSPEDWIELTLPDARQCLISSSGGLSEIYISALRHQAEDA